MTLVVGSGRLDPLSLLQGGFPNLAVWSKIGNNPLVSIANVPATVWAVPGVAYPWPAAAQAMEVVSSSPNDTAAGTGAQSVTVERLDASYNPLVETVALNGVTPVLLTGNALRVNMSTVATVGTGGQNAGAIDVRIAGGGAVLDRIPLHGAIGIGRSDSAVYTVPNGQTLYLFDMIPQLSNPSGGGTDNVHLHLHQRLGLTGPLIADFQVSVTNQSHFVPLHPSLPYLKFPATTDLEVQLELSTANNLSIDVLLIGILANNP